MLGSYHLLRLCRVPRAALGQRPGQPPVGAGQHARRYADAQPAVRLECPLQPPASWGGWQVWLSLLGLGLLCTAFAYILYFRLLAEIGPVKASTVTFLIPVFGVLWGAWLLDEPLSLAHLYGGLLIAVALWLVLRPARN